MCFSFRRLMASFLAAGMCWAVMPIGHAAFVYQQNFNDGNATPEVTPGNGVLGMAGSPAPVVNATGGVGIVPNGVLQNTNGSITTAGSNSVSATVASQGGTGINFTTLNATGTLSQFTVTFWFKVGDDYSASVSSTAGYRLLGLGPSGTTDGPTASGGLGIQLRPGSTSNPLRLDVSSKGNSGTSGGVAAVASPTEWNFVALSFDGLSTLGNNSSAQNTATGGASMINGQLYRGNDQVASTPSRFAIPMTTGGLNAATANDGPYVLGNSAALLLFNRIGTASDRNFDGFFDDIRIYDTVLNVSEVNAVRLEAIPEPNSCILMVIGLIGGFTAYRTRRAHRSDC
jgi:hypothetical protein